jgi:U32 family peptidase
MLGAQRVSICSQIQDLTRKVELLAPAGRQDSLEAVLEAGADAVYFGAKHFNMRHHRKDFNFGDSELREAIARVHRDGARAHIVVNSLLGEDDLQRARDLLIRIEQAGADAIILQDLGVLRLAQELSLGMPLHASTMMNVHHPEQALALKSLGIHRVIASRDIDLRTVAEIGRVADIETECFIHGDMCVAHSGQCSLSGVLFGKSSNRGECMKPCRWAYDLVRLDSDVPAKPLRSGHLLAIKDLCLLRHIPNLIQAGVCSFKIEGRMRDAAYLRTVVATYRQALDAYYACPTAFEARSDLMEQVYRSQVRRLSTLTLLGSPSHRDHFDTSGQREPLFLSKGCREASGDDQTLPTNGSATAVMWGGDLPHLAVAVADVESARAALEAGADRIYSAAERPVVSTSGWSLEDLAGFVELAHSRSVTVGVRTPRATSDREWAATRWLLERVSGLGVDHVLVHHLGTLRLARQTCPTASVIADYGLNVLNSAAAALLARHDVAQVTLSNEAGLADLHSLAEAAPMPLEVLAHGPIAGMLTEHCLMALYVLGEGRKDVCRGPCRHAEFGLKDAFGQVRPIVADQYCRNHLLTGHDLAILPEIERFGFAGVGSFRIEGQFYPAAHVGLVTRAYRLRLDAIHSTNGHRDAWKQAWEDARKAGPRPLNYGPYVRSIVDSRSTVEVMKELAAT